MNWKDIIIEIGFRYCILCSIVVTIILFSMAIFGGSIRIVINWHSLIDLIDAIKRYYK